MKKLHMKKWKLKNKSIYIFKTLFDLKTNKKWTIIFYALVTNIMLNTATKSEILSIDMSTMYWGLLKIINLEVFDNRKNCVLKQNFVFVTWVK